jgi:DNA helicase-2/ATP-dependent DNA helicase PcrA
VVVIAVRMIENKIVEFKKERNSAFAAITRARRFLYISYPQNKTMPWMALEQKPSQFLKDLGLIWEEA